MTDDERRGLDRLTQHADSLDQVIRLLGDPVRVIRTRGDIIDDLAHALYQEIRVELRQDYDAGEVGSRLGHYDVTALIGEGGMGEVCRARDGQLGVALGLR